MKSSKELIDFVKQTAVLANTPAFLFNTLRDTSDTLDFANSNTNNDLRAALLDLSFKTNRSPEDLALAYLLLIALSYKPDFNIGELDINALKWIDWSSEIVSLISMVNSSSISTARIEPSYQPEQSNSRTVAESSVAYESINLHNYTKE